MKIRIHRGMIFAALAVTSCGLQACGDAGALNAIPPGQLFAATNLSAIERKEHIRSLNWRVSVLVSAMYEKGHAKPAPDVIEELCECVVDNLQDRTSLLQFTMAMDAIKNSGFGAKPDLSSYRKLAISKGMSKAEFEHQARDLARHVASMAENCMRRLGGRG